MRLQIRRWLREEKPADTTRVHFPRRVDRFNQHRDGIQLAMIRDYREGFGPYGVGDGRTAKNVFRYLRRSRHLQQVGEGKGAKQIADAGGVAAGNGRAFAKALPPLWAQLAQ